jgi:iron complex outermembrane recepter protein
LTQFGATLVDPCGPTGAPVVDRTNGVSPGLEAACVAQGVPDNFEQANTQITTFTGGNASLEPETADSFTFGTVYSPSWGEDKAWSQKLDFEIGYYNHKVKGAVQSRDLQQLLNACIASGGTNATLCAPFTRQTNGNLNPPNNFLQNFGEIKTDGVDIKTNWISPEWGVGTFSASMQTTFVNEYKAVDKDGIVSSRAVGIETNDSAIPEWQSNLQLGWHKGNFSGTYGLRYIDAVEEDCNSAVISNVPGCLNPSSTNVLGSVTYHDVQFAWKNAFTMEGLKLSVGANNVFGKEPPICMTCSLNGYDAGTYDLPGAYWYVGADYRF